MPPPASTWHRQPSSGGGGRTYSLFLKIQKRNHNPIGPDLRLPLHDILDLRPLRVGDGGGVDDDVHLPVGDACLLYKSDAPDQRPGTYLLYTSVVADERPIIDPLGAQHV